jgi:hypothetical protein
VDAEGAVAIVGKGLVAPPCDVSPDGDGRAGLLGLAGADATDDGATGAAGTSVDAAWTVLAGANWLVLCRGTLVVPAVVVLAVVLTVTRTALLNWLSEAACAAATGLVAADAAMDSAVAGELGVAVLAVVALAVVALAPAVWVAAVVGPPVVGRPENATAGLGAVAVWPIPAERAWVFAGVVGFATGVESTGSPLGG